MRSVYEFRGTLKEFEDTTEEGTVKAINENSARKKLADQGYSDIQLKEIRGWKSLIRQVFDRD